MAHAAAVRTFWHMRQFLHARWMTPNHLIHTEDGKCNGWEWDKKTLLWVQNRTHSQEHGTSALYSRGPELKSWPRDQQSWQVCHCKISSFRNCVVGAFSILWYWATQAGCWLLRFQDNISVSSSRISQSKKLQEDHATQQPRRVKPWVFHRLT